MDAWKAEQARRILATPNYIDEGFIFVRQKPLDGQPLAMSSLQAMFHRLAKAAGLQVAADSNVRALALRQ